MEVTVLSGANGSTGPTGAKLSNERAASVGGGDSEELVEGEGWLYTVVGISNAPVAESGVWPEEDLGRRCLIRGRAAFAAAGGDVGSSLAIGFASSFSKKRE